MSLAAGERLGPYEIVAPLGSGGMGEVYRARDTRLGREVAVKILPAALSRDADRLRRFEQEARAASALNHHNIVTLFDVGQQGGAPYVVTELLEGETLRSGLAAGALSPRKATDYAIQIAQGLAAAHDKGIVHRDLKPENLFVTEDGRVKILDFGLAKLIEPDASGAPQTAIPTASLGTEPGVIMGTAGYMSPEQVKGQSADHRSDIFSFGAILYEMLAGRRAFQGDSAMETMSAILKEEPPDLSKIDERLSPGLERLVRHCLEKAPAQRFQSARDLAYDLEGLSSVSRPAAHLDRRQPPPRRGRLGIALACFLLAAAGAGFLLGRRGLPGASAPNVHARKLTFLRGFPLSARFAPDGKTVVYAAARDGGPYEIFLTRTDGTESRAIGVQNANVLAVSKSGEIALSLRRSTAAQFRMRSTLATVALLGGAPRPVMEDVLEAGWSPDGKQLSVVRWVDGKEVVESPIGRAIDSSDSGCTSPRVSPGGDLLAYFHRDPVGSSSLMIADARGRTRVLAKNLPTKGTLAWSPSGEEIWFDLDENGHTNIASASLGGSLRTLYSGLDWLFLDDVAADGTVLLSRWAARSAIYFRGPADAAERDLGWLDWGFSRDLSRDGSLLLFEELGAGGGLRSSVYARPTDGSPAIRLGDGSALSLSADGKSALVIRDGRIVIYPIGSGQPREVLTGQVKADYASFFPDGRHLRVNGFLPGHERRNWMLDLETGALRSITPEGPQQHPVLSPDGRSIAVAFLKEKRIVVYPVDSGGGDGRAIPGTLEGDHPLEWSADGKSLFVFHPEEILPKHVDRIDVATGRREPWKTLAPSDGSGTFGISGIAMTPDAASYVYTAERALAGDLFVIEGLK